MKTMRRRREGQLAFAALFAIILSGCDASSDGPSTSLADASGAQAARVIAPQDAAIPDVFGDSAAEATVADGAADGGSARDAPDGAFTAGISEAGPDAAPDAGGDASDGSLPEASPDAGGAASDGAAIDSSPGESPDGGDDGADGYLPEAGDAGALTATEQALYDHSPLCLSCAEDAGLLGPTGITAPCESFDDAGAFANCIATLRCLLASTCEANDPSGDPTVCLCGTVNPITCYSDEGGTPLNGACTSDYYAGYATMDVTSFQDGLFDDTTSPGAANVLVMYLAQQPCSSCF